VPSSDDSASSKAIRPQRRRPRCGQNVGFYRKAGGATPIPQWRANRTVEGRNKLVNGTRNDETSQKEGQSHLAVDSVSTLIVNWTRSTSTDFFPTLAKGNEEAYTLHKSSRVRFPPSTLYYKDTASCHQWPVLLGGYGLGRVWTWRRTCWVACSPWTSCQTSRTYSWSTPIPPADPDVIGCAYVWKGTVAESISTRSGDDPPRISNVTRRGRLIADYYRV